MTFYAGFAQSLQQSIGHLQLAPHVHWSPWQPEQTHGQQVSPLQSVSHLQVPGTHMQLAVEGEGEREGERKMENMTNCCTSIQLNGIETKRETGICSVAKLKKIQHLTKG